MVLTEFGRDRRRSLVSGRWHYITMRKDHELLFDMWTDPAESHNLANAAHLEPVLARFRAHRAAIEAQSSR